MLNLLSFPVFFPSLLQVHGSCIVVRRYFVSLMSLFQRHVGRPKLLKQGLVVQ